MLMNITWTYIWSQIFTVIEYVLLGTTYFAKKRKLVVILDTFSMLAGILSEGIIFLAATVGYIQAYHAEKLARRRRSRHKKRKQIKA